MIRFALPLLFFVLPAQAQVVRVASHGASGTVIDSRVGKNLILTCAHAFDDAESRARPIVLRGQTGLRSARLVAIDYARDLALLESGDKVQLIPVPPAPLRDESHPANPGYMSAGYEQGRDLEYYPATLKQTGPEWTYTVEEPRGGRSGGALMRPDDGRLYGVVVGFQVNEVTKERRGVYASLASVHRFLADHKAGKNAVPRMPYAED